MPLQHHDAAVVVDASGHEGRDGRELLTGARVRACGHGHMHIWRVGGQSVTKVAGFDRRCGRSQQQHEEMQRVVTAEPEAWFSCCLLLRTR